MIRTQVYLTEDQARDIKLKARRDRKPEAEIIRELLNDGLKIAKRIEGSTSGDALLRLAVIGAKGPADLSDRIDDYLYREDS